jgi:hypothetical protein
MPWAPLNTYVVFGLNIAVLWLVFERVNSYFMGQSVGAVMSWGVFGEHGTSLIHNASEVDIVCSSGGTFHTQFGEALSRRSKLIVRILMRKRATDSTERQAKLREWLGYWMALNDPSAKRTVEVRLIDQDLLRMMRVDDTVAFGYYSPDQHTQRLVGHTIDLLVVGPRHPDNAHFRRMFTSLFDRMWAQAEKAESRALASVST